ncbi:MAG: flagellar motor switch protein FliG [Pirellulaceae bacterium]|jgi:flagellar motor switch protein FliG|nr:flagellar motor switch protein FliG [Pirellulaceae bacterium]MDP7015052.1 flagellar motor switch protein FliG [Pirellulaceae bacterium]
MLARHERARPAETTWRRTSDGSQKAREGESVTDIRKAAILLMSLPEDIAGDVLGKLESRQVEAVSIELAQLGRLNGSEQEQVILEFADQNPNSLGGGAGNLEIAQALVRKALGKKASNTIDNLRQTIEGLPFGFLKQVDPQNLMTFVNDEHPQTIALILSHLPPAFGAEIIGGLTPERQLDVIRRIATMEQTSPEVIQQVEEGLERRMVSVMSQSFENAGGVSDVAEILNVTDRSTERALLENLSHEEPELVDEIRRLMFVFEDISKLTDKDVQSVLKNVESAQWAMALKGASEELKERILGNMSQRAAQMLNEEMEFLGAVRLADVEGVQQQIVDVVRRLEDSGDITTGGAQEDEAFVE